MYLDYARELFAQLPIAAEDIHPCTEEEVEQLEQQAGDVLPAVYREFLLWIGHRAGILLQGSDVYYQQLTKQKEWAHELLRENGIASELPNDAFVFYSHQGYQFMYFRLSEGDNPPVYYYGEGEGFDTIRRLYPSYSIFLETEIKGHSELIRTSFVRRVNQQNE